MYGYIRLKIHANAVSLYNILFKMSVDTNLVLFPTAKLMMSLQTSLQ